MLKKLALAVMMVCGAASAQNVTAPATLDPGQIYSTGNIVQQTTTTSGSTWVNGVYQDQLTCFAWGNPGYCGPNPIVRPGNNINFSFGWTDIYQQQAIASVLPSSGTGLRVNGYNFGFNAKNGNGWDDGRTDLLFAYVQFNDPQGASVLNHTHNLSYQFGWTTFNYNKTFDSPFAAKNLGSVRYGFVGKDNNNWAGPYGPEITNVSFGLTYSVDPCIKDPLYSPTCPGYMDALNKLLPPKTTDTAPVTETATVAPTTTTIATVETTAPTVSSAPPAPAPAAAPAATTTTTTASASASAAPTAAAPAGASRESTGGGGTAAGLAAIARNQQREQAIAAQAVQTATATAAAAAAASQQEAASVAAQAVTGSMGFAATQGGPAQSTGGQGIRVDAAQTQTGSTAVSTSAVSITPTISAALSNSVSVIQQSQSASIQTETASVLPNSALLDRSNALNEFFEPRVAVPQSSNNASSGPVVNRNASDNEAAAGVDINRMALAPQGYGDYLNFTLRDAAFYAPREVYRNQRTVDNARALRQLTNDSRHREMVEQQYRR